MLRISSVSLTFLIVAFHPPPQAADIMADFFERVAREPSYWDKISKAGLERIYSR
jgi:sucrose synthase